MKTKMWDERRHKAAAHDIPLLNLLLFHHCISCIATYDPAFKEHHPLANAARSALKAVELFKSELAKQAAIEYPEAEWLQEYTKEYDGEALPPGITDGEMQNES